MVIQDLYTRYQQDSFFFFFFFFFVLVGGVLYLGSGGSYENVGRAVDKGWGSR